MGSLCSPVAIRLRRLWSLPIIFLLAVLSLLPLGRILAFDQLELDIGALSGPGWQAEGLRFSLDWEVPEQTGYRLEIGSLVLPALQQRVSGAKIECRRGKIDPRRISCAEGEVILPHSLLDKAHMAMSFVLDRHSGKLSAKLRGIGIAAGRMDLDFQLDADAWGLRATGHGLKAESLVSRWPTARDLLAGWSLAARIDLDARISGRNGELLSARWQGALSDLGLGDSEGRYIGEGLAADFTGKLHRAGAAWRIDTGLKLNRGELLTPVCYLDASAHPLELEGGLSLDEGYETLALRDVQAHLEGLLDLRLEGDLRFDGERLLQRFKLGVPPFQAGDLFREILQPVLAGTPWGRAELAGEVGLSLDLQDEMLSLELGLQELNLDDTESDAAARRLGLYGMNGRVYWDQGGDARTSHLTWQAGHLLEHIDIGPAQVEFQASGEGFKLTRQARIPLLDGNLVVDKLEVAALGKPEQRLQFDGFLEPISMGSLSQALGWLPLSGKLSGMIPGLTYENGLLSVEGILAVRIFDGDILIKQLRTRDLFGVYPQVNADIELHNLDLESLTQTFSFGRITGRMDGYVRALSLEDWSPIAFDARFYTPQGDDSRHRISQRAVDNISNLGGAGLSGSLARSFMRFFKEFGYRRIGIGCRLRNGLCEMVGAGEAKQGYYLVQGSGIPRIDIIGYNSTADWRSLVEQLKQITTASTPVVQ